MAVGFSTLLTACDKADELPYYDGGSATSLTASANTIVLTAPDSNNVALILSWTDPGYTVDSTNVKYTIEIDEAGNNFMKAARRVVMTSKSANFLVKELNTILLGMGFPFNVPVDIEVRVISSYANNNEQLASNTVPIKMTPYKVPPKVPLPTTERLFIVGSATQGDWSNPVPLPTQELTRIDETTFGGIFQLNGGKEFLLLPLNGNWDHKYAVTDNTVPGLNTGGEFGYDFPQNIPGPTNSGLYKIIVDFQAGRFTVTEFTQQHGLPGNLFIVGGATPGGWTNPVPLPQQQFTRINATQFEIANLALTAGEKYLFLPENGNWGMKFGAVDAGASDIDLGGPFVPEGQDIPAPGTSGNYKITVDFIDNSYKLVKL